MPIKKTDLAGSTWDTFIKVFFTDTSKKFFRNTWSDLGHFHKKNIFGTIKKIC